MCLHPLWGKNSVKVAYMAELQSRNHCWGSKTMSKGFSGPRLHKDWTIAQWNKVLWTEVSKFEISGSNRRVYMWRRVNERAGTSCITPTIKHGVDSIMVWCAFALCKVGDLHQVKSSWIRPGITAYGSITWSYLERGLLLKDLYSCKIITQSIQVNSARDILKSKGRVRPSTDTLVGAISGLKSHWTGMRWTWPKSQLNKSAHLLQLLQESWVELSSVYLQSLVERIPRISEVRRAAKRGSILKNQKFKKIFVFICFCLFFIFIFVLFYFFCLICI